jgi:hypothetical protein
MSSNDVSAANLLTIKAENLDQDSVFVLMPVLLSQ